MSRNRFEVVLSYLRYIYIYDVGYYGGFFHLHQMEEAQNLNMGEEFNPSRINLLDEIIMEWF